MIKRFNIAGTVLVGMSQAVRVRPDRCSRMCHKSAKCTICETNCPGDAISVGAVGTKIDINWEKCTYCGICINVCPSGVYSLRDRNYFEYLDSFVQKIDDTGKLTIVCHQYNNEHRQTADNGAVVECLGIFGLPDVLYFYTHGAVEISFKSSTCTTCTNLFGMDILKDELSELSRIAPHFEHLQDFTVELSSNAITIKFSKQFDKSVSNEAQKEQEKTLVDRRAMFNSLKENAFNNFMKSASLLTPQQLPNRTQMSDAKEIPFKREVFLKALVECGKLLQSEATAGSYFFSQEISVGCTLCRVCTRFCPTGALHMNADNSGLEFHMADCVSCGMCLISCYHKKIKPSKKVNLKELFKDIQKYTEPANPVETE